MGEILPTLLFLLTTVTARATAESLEVCTLCVCRTVSRVDTVLEVDCSSKETVGDISNYKWPQNSRDLISAVFAKSKWRKVERLPLEVRDNIESLSLASNIITEVELEEFVQLRLLNLTDNLIDKLTTNAFKNLPQLVRLDLSHNRIERIASLTFAKNVRLVELNLAFNSIKSFSHGSLTGLAMLSFLDVSFNNLTGVPDTFAHDVAKLTKLVMRHNEMSSGFNLPDNLTYLDVSFNQLTTGALESWATAKQLLYLDASQNMINDSPDISRMENLKSLNISGNNISVVAWLSSDLLNVLDVSYNQLSEVPSVNGAMLPDLQELYLDGNPIKELSFATDPLTPFQHLSVLSASRLTALTHIRLDTFQGLTLSRDQNKPVDCVHAGLAFNLAHNALKDIDPKAFNNLPLCFLSLRDNKLTTLSEEMWQHVYLLDLQDNPWRCDCELQWLLEKVVPWLYQTDQTFLTHLNCSTPKRFERKNFVYWLDRTTNVFCQGPAMSYFMAEDGTVYEFWTINVIASIILAVLICILLIVIIVLLSLRYCRKTKPDKRLSSSRNSAAKSRPYYKEIRQTIDHPKALNEGV